MELEQTGESSVPVHKALKDPKHVEPEPTRQTTNNHSFADDAEYTQRIPTIKDGAQMSNPPSISPSSLSSVRQQPHHRNGVSNLIATDDDLSPSEVSSEAAQIVGPQRSPAKNRVSLSRSPPKTYERVSTSPSPLPSASMSTSRVHPLPNPTTGTIYKSLSTVPPQPRHSRFHSIPNNGKPSVQKKRKTYHTSLGARTITNPKSPHRHSSFSKAPSVKTSAPRVDPNNLTTLEYDLDRDPTQQAYEFRDLFHELSPFSAMLSARFIHAHLFERLSDSTASNDEPTNSEGDLVTEFIEPAALNSASSHNTASPSYALNSAEMFGSSDPTPGCDDIELEGAGHIPDPFAVPRIDDVIDNQPWEPDAETTINPSLLGGTTAFSEPRFPSPAPTPFRNFHSQRRTRTPSPPPTRSVLTVRIPTRVSGSNLVQTSRDIEGNVGGGKAKFYKKGALQAPPYLSNSQRRRSVSAKTTESTHTSRRSSLDQVASAEINSPLTELSVSDMPANGVPSSIVTPSEVTNSADGDFTVIDSWSRTPSPRDESIKTSTTRKKKSGTDQKGPYRIVAVNENSSCHQCRHATPHPKMHCRTCAKRYCIMCIVKRYHHIEFHQFKKDFDCPACLNACNCTLCCDKRKEVYVTTRHIKFDGDTMAKLLSGEIRSLPHLSASFAGPRKKLKPGQDPLRCREPPPTARKERMPIRRKRISSRREASDDDYDDESDAPKVQSISARPKPTDAALQTQKMLKESGSGRYWGAVYSLNGERIGMSYVGSNLQNITLRTPSSSSASVTDCSPSPSRHRRERAYVGKWQDTWGFHPETLDGSHPDDETRTHKRSRDKETGYGPFHYVGNQNVIKAWRRAQFKAVQQAPVAPPPSDDIDIHTHPYDSSFDNPSAYDRHEATDAPPNDGIPVDGEGGDDDDGRSYWIMGDRSSPAKPDLPIPATADISPPGLDNVNNVLGACLNSALIPCGQPVTQEELVKAVASSLEAVGTTVLLPQPPLWPPPLSS